MRGDYSGFFEDADAFLPAPPKTPAPHPVQAKWRAAIDASLMRQHGHVLPWIPCFFGGGIILFFMQKSEPSILILVIALAVFGGLIWGSRKFSLLRAPLLGLVAMIALGFFWAGLRSHMVAAPVLTWYYNGPIEGRVTKIDQSASGVMRVTLDQLTMADLDHAPPATVRISLHGDAPELWPGHEVRLRASLSPPSGPAEPGGFDFQRHAWFQRLGGVGYTRSAVEIIAPPQGFWINRVRLQISRAIWARIDGQAGAVAAAITTGDRSKISAETTQALRGANLSHLLAISGLHMGLLTGVVFAGLRLFFSLTSRVSAHFDGKKVAALGAIISGFCYLLLSGQSVATERAFIMAVVFFGAVLLDRHALTLRGVAIAAMIVLLLRPEALMGPGFQMSFAATTALVIIFGQMGPWGARNPIVSVLLSSFIAGLATAPFSAAHFNMVASYGLLANFVSVPVMGILIMPSFVLAVLAAPFGLEWLPLWGAEQGLRWIIWVAEHISSWPHAMNQIATPMTGALGLLTLGCLWAGLWQDRARWAGLGLIAVAILGWNAAPRPQILISHSGGLVGIMTSEGRALSKSRGDGFSADMWLENDGDPTAQAIASERSGWSRERYAARYHIGDLEILSVRGKQTTEMVEGCGGADIFITNQWERYANRPCLSFDKSALWRSGSIAMEIGLNGEIATTSARDVSGYRLWNSRYARAQAAAQLNLIQQLSQTDLALNMSE